jgi:hypothetical protein
MNAPSPSKKVDPAVATQRLMQQANNRDGLPEILAGAGFLIGSGMCWSDQLHESTQQQIASLVATLLMMAFCLACGPTLRWLRERCLIARVGYVRFRPADKPRQVLAILITAAVAVSVLFVVRTMRSAEPLKWLIALVGLLTGVFQVVIGRLPRFWFTGAFAVVAAFLLASSNLSFSVGLGVFFDLVGVVEIITGSIVLLRFLQQPAENGV